MEMDKTLTSLETLKNNLENIYKYQTEIKQSIDVVLESKGLEVKEDVKFSEYSSEIEKLLTENEPSTPTPSADYIYCNGNEKGGAETDIINFTPFEIKLDDNGKFIIEVISPEEIPGYEGGTYYDIVFTVEVPTTYQITNFELYAEALSEYVQQAYKVNPRHSTIVREGVTYNSYVRAVSDGIDIGSADVQYSPLQYRITIEKK